MSLPSDLRATTQADLERLIADKTPEGPHLDFKRGLPLAWNNEAKHELAADVSAFANAGGGELLFGITEVDAVAGALVPQTGISADPETLRLQQMLRGQVEPPIPGVGVFAVPVCIDDVAGHVFVIRVPQSWAGPHRVKENRRFFVRDGAQKRDLDMPEIRGLFLRSESQAQKVRDFRTERLGKLMCGEGPHKLVDGPILVVHLVPTQAALGLVHAAPTVYLSESQRMSVPMLGGSHGETRINLDGALSIRPPTEAGETRGYSLQFRNGFFEATQVLEIAPGRSRARLSSAGVEESLQKLLQRFRMALHDAGVGAELAAMVSLLRADEVLLAVPDPEYAEPHQTLFDRGTLVLPDVLIPAVGAPAKVLKPVFDLLWQAAGFPGSGNYDDAGEWNPKR